MKKLLAVLLLLLSSCGTYQITPVDKCCETDVVYLDEIKGDSVNIFTSLDFNTITLDFRPIRPRFNWGYNYGYWNERPLWLDYGFYNNNYYSYYSNFYRPWNYWGWYMRPWMASNSWYEGPFNNQGYNVVYNASRRGSLTTNINSSISNRVQTNRIVNVNKRPVNNNAVNTLITNYKPNNNVIVKPNNNWKPNNNKPIIRNNNSRPNFNNNSRPSFNNNSRPSNNVISRPSSPSRGGKNPR
jgi:hypothetical protein